MPLPFFVSGALFTGVASGIWSYNRENYMWDWQNRQARDFQIQNMIVSRYGLFREDIRDLAGLTTSKMDSYLVVNTLKLGFIVSVFFNYDRTDEPSKEGTPAERQFVLLFSVCFLTAFQMLLTSVWFSMHASVVAQSFMTKMLLQTVRIPFPSDRDINATAPEARDYERDLSTAFRIPLMQGRGPPPPVSSTGGGSAGASSAASVSGMSQASSVRRPSKGQLPGIPSLGSDSTRRPSAVDRHLGLPDLRRNPTSTRSPQPGLPEERSSNWSEDELFSQLGRMEASVRSGLQGQARAEGSVDGSGTASAGAFRSAVEAPGVAPHLKFYGLIMSNWQPYDLYSKICMSIGTSAMLSGIAYFSIFYTRPPATETSTINAGTEGWYTFLFMSVLAWWSVTLDLILKTWEHVLAGLVALGAPACIVVLSLSDDRSLWLMPLAVLMQAAWVWFLCGTAVVLQDGWPRRWRASLFLDVLGTRGAGAAARTASPGGHGRANACRDSALELLQCLKAAAELPMPEQLLEEVRRTISRLEESTANTRPPSAPEGGTGARQANDNGFWLVVPAQEGAAPRTHWIHSPSGAKPGESGPGAAQAATLEELLGAAHSTLAAMFIEEASPAWTAEDAEQLAQYGGQMGGSTVEGFESQFRSKGLNAKSHMGKAAHRFFRASVGFVCVSWATAVLGCLVICQGKHRRHPQESPQRVQLAMAELGAYVGQVLFPWLSPEPATQGLARMIASERLRLPRPWYAPTALSCSADGKHIALADGVRAFVTAANGSWMGPFAACGGADVTAIAFAGDQEEQDEVVPRLVAASAGGAFPLPRGPRDAELCEAIDWTPSAPASSSSAARPTSLALDSAAISEGAGLRGLAVRDGQVVALEAGAAGAWEVAGALPAPASVARRWTAVAIHAGIGFALDDRGAVFELDAATGTWAGPWRLEESGLAWRGLCALPGGGGGLHWLVLGERSEVEEGAGSPPRRTWELWRFERPGEQVWQEGLAGGGAVDVPEAAQAV